MEGSINELQVINAVNILADELPMSALDHLIETDESIKEGAERVGITRRIIRRLLEFDGVEVSDVVRGEVRELLPETDSASIAGFARDKLSGGVLLWFRKTPDRSQGWFFGLRVVIAY
jgi:hypothetical protein